MLLAIICRKRNIVHLDQLRVMAKTDGHQNREHGGEIGIEITLEIPRQLNHQTEGETREAVREGGGK